MKSLLVLEKSVSSTYRPISQSVFILSIATNKAEPVCAIVIIEHITYLRESISIPDMCKSKSIPNLINYDMLCNRSICNVLWEDGRVTVL